MAMTNYTAWRVSNSGAAIVAGQGSDRKVIMNYPGNFVVLDEQQFTNWLIKAEEICELQNSLEEF
jgi:hypothetical protein